MIPQEVREELGIKPGSRLAWSIRDGVAVVMPVPEDPIAASYGMLKGSGFTFQDFMDERNRERARERAEEESTLRRVSPASGKSKATKARRRAG